ncbi:hypothetical protein ONZ45_g8013 [Pleurotus djamor]|nr:hypothetical protein ONZ45_g8013 [Pleurotus djamor]
MSSGKFIVVFKEHATPEQIQEYVDKVNSTGGKVTNNYGSGFAAELEPSHLTNFQGDDIIDYVEPDSIVTTQ